MALLVIEVIIYKCCLTITKNSGHQAKKFNNQYSFLDSDGFHGIFCGKRRHF
jgi:hypothetical protein